MKMKANKSVLSITLVLLIALLLASCAGPAATASPAATEAPAQPTSAPASNTPIKIGLYQGLTGPLAFIGEGYKLGVDLAVHDLGGSIEGHPIEITTADSKCNPTDTVNAVRKLTDVDQVDVLIGGGCSGATLAALPIVAEAETPSVDGTSTNATIYNQMGVGGNKWMFRIGPDDLIMGLTFAQYIKDQGVSTVSFVGDDNAFGRGAGQVYDDVFKRINVNVSTEDYFDPATADFRPALTKIKGAGADALLIVMTEQSCATLMRQFREQGLTLKVYSRGACTSGVFNDLTKDDPKIGEGIIEFSFFNEGQDTKLDAEFPAIMNQPTSGHRMAGYYIMYYTIAPALESLIKSGKEINRANIRDAIAAVNMKTPAGTINFDDHNQAYVDGTLSTNKDGKAVLLDTVPLKPVDHTGYNAK
jgi:branched-chain amino acid transport system substrate-binding protein